MSYQVAGRPPAKIRPGVVTAGAFLLYVVAALILLLGALSAVTVFGYGDLITSQVVQGIPVGQMTRIVAIVTSILYVVLAAGAIATGVLVSKGRAPARVVAWSLAGVIALCCGCQSISGLLSSSLQTSQLQTTDPNIENALNSIPSWINVANEAGSIGLVFSSIAVIVLLSVPAANDFFRKEEQVWVPPTWNGEPGYAFPPGAPQPYPQPPQVPQYPQYPSAQPYPPAQAYPPAQPYPPAQSYPPASQPPYPPAQSYPPAQPYPPAQSYPPGTPTDSPSGPPPSDQQPPPLL